MSKFIKRLGTKKQSYSFDITVHYVTVGVNVPVRIHVIWKRRKIHIDGKRVETKKYALSPSIGSVELNETITMLNTLYQEKTGNFQKKSAVLIVNAIVDNRGIKKLGEVSINLNEYIQNDLVRAELPIAKCGDKKARVCVSVHGHSIGENISDNASDASEQSGPSMGTEEDFSGTIFHENEASGIEEESKKNAAGKPPVFRKTQEIKQEPEEKARYIDILAKNSVLEKENQQLKSEKDDIKIQLKLMDEKAKKEREMFCDHAKKLDADIDLMKIEIRKLKEKLQRRKEKTVKVRKSYEEALNEIETLKKSYSQSEKIKFMDDIKNIKKKVFDAEEKVMQLTTFIERLQNDKELIENSRDQLQSLNLKYLADISKLSKKNTELEELLITKIPDDQSVYKKRTDTLVNELRKELEVLQNERDDAVSAHTDALAELQKMKKTFSSSEEKYKEKIRRVQFELDEKNQEIQGLNERLEEEIQNNRNIERKTLSAKEEFDERFSKLNSNLKEVTKEKEIIEKSLIENKRAVSRNRSETEPSSYEKWQKSIVGYQNEIQKLKIALKIKEEENQELAEKVSRYENGLLIGNIEIIEGSTESDLAEKLNSLKAQIESNNALYIKEKTVLNDKIKLLERESQIVADKNKEALQLLENQLMALKIENITIKENKGIKFESTSEFLDSMKEESLKQMIEMKKIENKELKGLVVKMQDELKNMEKKYMDFKVTMANLELQKENVSAKYRETQHTLEEYSLNYSLMEKEFYRVNEKFGWSLNENNELVNEIERLKEEIYVISHRKNKNKPS